jgi:hypothetical protein
MSQHPSHSSQQQAVSDKEQTTFLGPVSHVSHKGHRQAGIRHVSGTRIHSWIGRAGLAICEQGIDRRKAIELTCPVRNRYPTREAGG